MNQATQCPSATELRQLLDGSLSGDRQQTCTDHLEACPCCQGHLEQLAIGDSKLSDIVQRLAEAEAPAATSAYWPAIKLLDAEAGGAPPRAMPQTVIRAQAVLETPPDKTAPLNTPVSPKPRARDVSLSFLQPASDAAYLGRLAHFDVMRILGRGGMGLVLEAFDSKLQRNVAVKVLAPELADDEIARQRFCREARAAASISHENVVSVHQVERAEDNQLPYLVMQVVNGGSLEDRLQREKRLPVREVVRIGMQAAHGLAAAHAQGLIHRDIKPGNILLEAPHGRVKLTDFGLARVADDMKLTQTGFVAGTPLYMAPEQALGDPPDHRSDLFSLGVIMYEMCAGAPPFTGHSAPVILKQIATVKHKPLRELNPEIPDWLAGTIDLLLAKKPADRIQTAAHLAELLEYEWAMLKTTNDEPVVCQIEERKRVIRNRWIAAAIGASFLAVGLFAGAFFASGPARDPSVATVSSASPVAVLAADAGAVWSVAIDSKSHTVAMGIEDGSVRLWDLPTESVKSTLTAHRGVVWNARFIPGSDLLATSGDDGLIKLWKPGQTEPVTTFPHMNAVRGLAVSPDGKQLFAGDREGGLRVWDRDAPQQPVASAEQPGAVYAVAISPDNTTLATAGSDKVVRLWQAQTLTQKLTIDRHAGPVYGLAFNHNGRRLASVGWDKTVRIWDAAAGQPVKSWEGHAGDIWSVAYSPDGTNLATGGHDGAVKVWDAETGLLLATYLGHKVAIHTVAFSDDGKLLGSGGRDGAVRVWRID